MFVICLAQQAVNKMGGYDEKLVLDPITVVAQGHQQYLMRQCLKVSEA